MPKYESTRRSLLFVFLLVLPVIVIAQNSEAKRKGTNCRSSTHLHEPWLDHTLGQYCHGTRYGHLFSLSSEAPITNSLSKTAYSNVAYFENAIETIANTASVKRELKFMPRECTAILWAGEGENDQPEATRRQRSWANAAIVYGTSRGFKYPKSHCFTSVELPTNSKFAFDFSSHLESFNSQLNSIVVSLSTPRSTRTEFDRLMVNWPTVDGALQRTVSGDLLKCRVSHLPAFRIGGTWSVGTRITNAPLDKSLADGARHFLGEIINTGPDGGLQAIPMSLYRKGDDSGPVNDTTTSISSWGGKVEISYFTKIETENLAVMQRIRQETGRERQYLLETIVPSNVAILALPIFMTLVPISCIEQVDTSVLILYSLISDVLSTLPLAIMGVELLSAAHSKRTACDAWLVGAEGKELAIGEVWCAVCDGNTTFSVYGSSFIATAVFFMLAGISAELIAYWYYNRRKKYKYDDKFQDCAEVSFSVSSAQASISTCHECLCLQSEPSSYSYGSQYLAFRLWDNSSKLRAFAP